MAEVDLTTPDGTVKLRRPHVGVDSPLRAWSSADELALAQVGSPATAGSTLIVNDAWGALAVALAEAGPTLWNDSALARSAIADNLGLNGRSLPAANYVTGDQRPTDGHFDTVLVVIPKTLSLLEYQLGAITGAITPDTRVIGLGMARHIHRSTIAAFENTLGPTVTTRATKKARLILTTPDQDRLDKAADPPPATSAAYRTAEGIGVAAGPGVFSAERLDSGTELLLDHLADLETAGSGLVADLGCGNGVVAATLARRWSQARFELFDVSDLAVATARRTWADNVDDIGRARFVVADGFGPDRVGPFDLVVTNPPFHQDHALDPGLTDRLLASAAERLSPDGVLAVVAQRHLKLHRRLGRWFASVETVSSHPSHVVMLARRAGAGNFDPNGRVS